MPGLFGSRPRQCAVRVVVPFHVVQRFTQEILTHPKVEVGGKYVGLIQGRKRYDTLAERRAGMADLVLQVLDYIDDGPHAERSAGFHRGDAQFQTQEFRQLEARLPEIEHLGSWHSHHPNGLSNLSEGDIRGYRETVNADGHNHDFFFVSLGVDRNGFKTARHFLFVRGDKDFYELSGQNLTITATNVPHPTEIRQESTPSAASDASHREDRSIPRHADKEDFRTRIAVPGWSDSRAGQERLARDQQLMRSHPALRHVVAPIDWWRLDRLSSQTQL